MEEVSVLRIRIRFSKQGMARFIGHLDVMRYFQKAIRRAQIPAIYSAGFHPHMLMSFASPLGVGVTSRSEYFDLDVEEGLSSAEMRERLNAQMTEDFAVLEVVRIPEEKAHKGMRVVAAAAYAVAPSFDDPGAAWEVRAAIDRLLQRDVIEIEKTTKTGTRRVDIRPHIYELCMEGEQIHLLLAADSANFLKPEAVMRAIGDEAGREWNKTDLRIERIDLYADIGEKERDLVPLCRLGEEIA